MYIPFGVFSAGAGGETNSFELISTTLISTNTSSVTFNSIPSGYTHLQIRATAQHTSSGATFIRFNGDSATNYSYHYLFGNGSSVSSTGLANQDVCYLGYVTTGTNKFAASVIDILDFASTSKYKTVKTLHGDNESNIMLNSSNWRSTSAISSITLYPNVNYISGSRFSLYGIRG